jgi:putative protein-disulfide isomerase
MMAVLHYIHDPLCGWCYGAEPLVEAARGVAGLSISLHGGCLWPRPTQLPENTRRYIQSADAKIAQMSGQPFGKAYLQGLLLDPSMILESKPTIAAVLAAESLDPAKGIPMLQAIQHAHYEDGRRVVERAVLCDIAEECGLVRDSFVDALSDVPVDEHIAQTHSLMHRVGAQGFPTFVLQRGDSWHTVPHSRFAGAPARFREWLTGLEPHAATV